MYNYRETCFVVTVPVLQTSSVRGNGYVCRSVFPNWRYLMYGRCVPYGSPALDYRWFVNSNFVAMHSPYDRRSNALRVYLGGIRLNNDKTCVSTTLRARTVNIKRHIWNYSFYLLTRTLNGNNNYMVGPTEEIIARSVGTPRTFLGLPVLVRHSSLNRFRVSF